MTRAMMKVTAFNVDDKAPETSAKLNFNAF